MNIILGVLTSIIGILLVALRLKGGELHKVQLQLLDTLYKNTNEEDKKAVEEAYARFSKSYNDYLKAKQDD